MARNAKIKFLCNHWRELLMDVLKSSIASFGVIITFADAFLNVFPQESMLYNVLFQLVHLPFDKPITIIILLLFLIIIATIANWPKTKAVFKDSHSDIKVILECCDIFEQEGLRVIHTVDTFDTELNTIISPKSVHGIFLQKAQQANVDIEKVIDNYLKHEQPVGSDEQLPGRKLRYKLGTVCPANIGKDQYAMVSFSHLQPNGSISTSKNEYVEFLLDMWRNLSNPLVRQETINVTVMGNRFVDLPADFSTEQKIDFLIQTFFAVSREKSCCKTLRICVHESNMAEVDFPHYENIISHLSKRPVI